MTTIPIVASALGDPPVTGGTQFGTNTLTSIQGILEQRYPSQSDDLLGGRAVTSCLQCHPAQTGRGAWQSSISDFITDWLTDPWLPRISFLATLILDTETHTQCLAGAYDTQYQWLADQIKNRIFPKIGTAHPVTGKILRGIDLCQLDWVHEANIAGTNATCLAPAARPDGTPANLAKCARRMVNVMRAKQPSFTGATSRPVMCWCPAQSGDGSAATAMIQSWPGDNYVDLIAMDVYAGGFTNPNGGSFDNILHHQQSWARTLTGFTLSLNGFMAPFCAATASNFAVQACNAANHQGLAPQFGGRLVAKPMGFIEVGCIAIDRTPTGGDGVIDGGTGDNALFINNFADWLDAELQKPLTGDQVTHKERVQFMNYFDINVKPNRTSHRLSDDNSTDRFVYHFPNAAAAYANRFG
jgi:hypothetical protein